MTEALNMSYEIFFENVKQPMYISSSDGQFRRVNKAFAKMLGYSTAELVIMKVERILAFPTG